MVATHKPTGNRFGVVGIRREQVKELREKSGLTQTALAEQLGLSLFTLTAAGNRVDGNPVGGTYLIWQGQGK